MGVTLDHETAMQYCGGMEELYTQILELYCSNYETYAANLEKFCAAQAWDQYRVQIHSVKSNSLNIGAKDMYEKALELEQACKEGRGDYVAAHHAEAMQLYDETRKEAQRHTAQA